MKLKYNLIILFFLSPVLFAEVYTSKYVDEEHREIKSLSFDGISELKKGAGWGLAKVANHFVNKTINQTLLEKLVYKIGNIRSKLRVTHLSTHLQTPNILSSDQINLYNQLRGYSNDPCNNIPEGHNAEMWKKHNSCNK